MAFPIEALSSLTRERREELSSHHNTNCRLLIDLLIEESGLKDLWIKDNGDGMYPPSSLHSVLIMFLENISEDLKHQIVQYLFHDYQFILGDNPE